MNRLEVLSQILSPPGTLANRGYNPRQDVGGAGGVDVVSRPTLTAIRPGRLCHFVGDGTTALADGTKPFAGVGLLDPQAPVNCYDPHDVVPMVRQGTVWVELDPSSGVPTDGAGVYLATSGRLSTAPGILVDGMCWLGGTAATGLVEVNL